MVIRENQSDHVRHVTASPGAPQSLARSATVL
jgi:hypothetical protein